MVHATVASDAQRDSKGVRGKLATPRFSYFEGEQMVGTMFVMKIKPGH